MAGWSDKSGSAGAVPGSAPSGQTVSGQTAPGETEVQAICALLEEHRAAAVAALDLRELHSWTDFFVIATVSSGAHLQGLIRHIKDFAAETGLTVLRGQTKGGGDNGWSLIDMGTAVIHLMTAQSREFYELEELWSSAGRIFPPG